ncbi:hypothetical protein Ahy_A02g006059 [Arachis hypogaea]|uniref:Uncharacterized protein n=1 Tax=Arachis hypogaea TaxID=3818 RepID=A0A445E8T7_ARAHY|nr:hypothetical protein Ahy_A02g006059 [Arachis hypogaea]
MLSRDAVCDDLLDEIITKVAIQEDPGNFLSRIFNSQDRDMVVTRIEEVIARLEVIAKHKDILGLKNIAAKNMSGRIPSTSLVKKPDIFALCCLGLRANCCTPPQATKFFLPREITVSRDNPIKQSQQSCRGKERRDNKKNSDDVNKFQNVSPVAYNNYNTP